MPMTTRRVSPLRGSSPNRAGELTTQTETTRLMSYVPSRARRLCSTLCSASSLRGARTRRDRSPGTSCSSRRPRRPRSVSKTRRVSKRSSARRDRERRVRSFLRPRRRRVGPLTRPAAVRSRKLAAEDLRASRLERHRQCLACAGHRDRVGGARGCVSRRARRARGGGTSRASGCAGHESRRPVLSSGVSPSARGSGASGGHFRCSVQAPTRAFPSATHRDEDEDERFFFAGAPVCDAAAAAADAYPYPDAIAIRMSPAQRARFGRSDRFFEAVTSRRSRRRRTPRRACSSCTRAKRRNLFRKTLLTTATVTSASFARATPEFRAPLAAKVRFEGVSSPARLRRGGRA